MFKLYTHLFFLSLLFANTIHAQQQATSISLGAGLFSLSTPESFSVHQSFSYSYSESSKPMLTAGLSAAIEQKFHENWSASFHLIGQQGSNNPIVIEGKRSNNSGVLENYEIRQARKLWAYSSSLLLHRNLLNRYFHHKLAIAGGISLISYEKEYLSALVLNENDSVFRRDFTTERGSKWGLPFQLRFIQPISDKWSLSATGQITLFNDGARYMGAALSVHYCW